MKRKTPYLYVVLALLAGAILGANPVRDVVRDGLVRDVARDITDVPFTTESAILSLSGMSYWVAGTETDSQNLTQLGSSGAGDAQFGSTSGADSNDPTSLPWYSTSDYDVTVDGVNYKYLSDNLVTNGTFDADYSGWDAIAAWSASDGVASIDGTGGSNGYSRQNILTVGKTYMVTFDITSLDAGYFDGWNGVSLSYGGTSTGTKSLVYTAAITHFYITGRSSAIGSIDNVVVREVTANLGDSVWLPGTSGNYLSHPDSAAVSVTGSIDARWEVALDDYANGSVQTIGGKWVLTGNQRSWLVQINATGAPIFYISDDGSGTGAGPFTFSTTIPTSDGVKVHFRFTYDTATTTARFYTSSDGSSWSQLGSDQTSCAKTTIYDSTATLSTGPFNGGIGDPTSGKFYSSELWNGIEGSGGTLVQNWLASSMTQGGGADEESGGTWTINRSASGLKSTLVTRPVIVFNSAASTYLTVADHDDLDMEASDDFTVWVYGRKTDTSTNTWFLLDKRFTAAEGYALYHQNATGQFPRFYTHDGTANSTTATTPTYTKDDAELFAGLKTSSGISYSIDNTLSSETSVTLGDLSNSGTLKIGVAYSATSPVDLEFFAAGVLKGSALTATQLASLKTELDTLLGGRSGE